MAEGINLDRRNYSKSSSLLKKFLNGRTSFKGDFPDEVFIVVAGFWWVNPDKKGDYRTVRLYTSLDLNEYIEFEWGLIRNIENYDDSTREDPKNPANEKPLVPVVVWLDRNARVKHARRADDESIVRQEEFLAGDIVDLYLQPSAQELPTRSGRGARGLHSLFQPCSFGGCGSNQCGGEPCVSNTK